VALHHLEIIAVARTHADGLQGGRLRAPVRGIEQIAVEVGRVGREAQRVDGGEGIDAVGMRIAGRVAAHGGSLATDFHGERGQRAAIEFKIDPLDPAHAAVGRMR
jgi:hypothetical protein